MITRTHAIIPLQNSERTQIHHPFYPPYYFSSSSSSSSSSSFFSSSLSSCSSYIYFSVDNNPPSSVTSPAGTLESCVTDMCDIAVKFCQEPTAKYTFHPASVPNPHDRNIINNEIGHTVRTFYNCSYCKELIL